MIDLTSTSPCLGVADVDPEWASLWSGLQLAHVDVGYGPRDIFLRRNPDFAVRGSPTLEETVYGQTTRYEGSSSIRSRYIVPHRFAQASNLTHLSWFSLFRSDVVDTSLRMIVSGNFLAGAQRWMTMFNLVANTALSVSVTPGSGWTTVTLEASPVAGQWYAAGATFRAGSITGYLDGVSKGTTVGTDWDGYGEVAIGNDRTGTEALNGVVPVTYVWHRALTASEHLKLATDPLGLVRRSLLRRGVSATKFSLYHEDGHTLMPMQRYGEVVTGWS